MFRVVTNGRFLSRSPTGVDRVAEELLRAIDARLDVDSGLRATFSLSLAVPPDAQRGLALRHVEERVVGRRRGQAWEQIDLPRSLRGAFLFNPCNSGPLAVRRSLTILHDAQVRQTPEAYSRSFRLWYRLLQPVLGRRSAGVATVSEASRQSLEAFGIVPAGRLHVVPNGCDHIDRIDLDSGALDRHGLVPGGYFLAIGSLSPHKNIGVLLEAAKRRRHAAMPLVIAGGGDPRVFANAGLAASEGVRFLGRVDDGELKALYGGAAALLMPSRFEGFGLPAAEAMRCGCPVVASASAPALREVCGEAALYADPDDASQWAARMDEIARNEALRRGLAQAGRERSQLFSWQDAAGRMVEALLSAGRAGRASSGAREALGAPAREGRTVRAQG